MGKDALYEDDKELAMHRNAIHDLSRECGLPEQEIGKIYEENLGDLKKTARVKDFLVVLTRRLVKESLRNRH